MAGNDDRLAGPLINDLKQVVLLLVGVLTHPEVIQDQQIKFSQTEDQFREGAGYMGYLQGFQQQRRSPVLNRERPSASLAAESTAKKGFPRARGADDQDS